MILPIVESIGTNLDTRLVLAEPGNPTLFTKRLCLYTVTQGNDVDANYHSRQVLTKAALREQALLFATHIPTVGRLQQTDSGSIWEAV